MSRIGVGRSDKRLRFGGSLTCRTLRGAVSGFYLGITVAMIPGLGRSVNC